MFELKDNIYKIMTIMNINDASIPHDMQVIGLNIIRSHISFFRPDE
jgi:hypothetical protein